MLLSWAQLFLVAIAYPQGVTVPIPIFPVTSPSSQLLQAILSHSDMTGQLYDYAYAEVRKNAAEINDLGDGQVTWFLPSDEAIERATKEIKLNLLKCTDN